MSDFQLDVGAALAVLLVQVETELAVCLAVDYHDRDIVQRDGMGERTILRIEFRICIRIEPLFGTVLLHPEERVDEARASGVLVGGRREQGIVDLDDAVGMLVIAPIDKAVKVMLLEIGLGQRLLVEIGP